MLIPLTISETLCCIQRPRCQSGRAVDICIRRRCNTGTSGCTSPCQKQIDTMCGLVWVTLWLLMLCIRCSSSVLSFHLACAVELFHMPRQGWFFRASSCFLPSAVRHSLHRTSLSLSLFAMSHALAVAFDSHIAAPRWQTPVSQSQYAPAAPSSFGASDILTFRKPLQRWFQLCHGCICFAYPRAADTRLSLCLWTSLGWMHLGPPLWSFAIFATYALFVHMRRDRRSVDCPRLGG